MALIGSDNPYAHLLFKLGYCATTGEVPNVNPRWPVWSRGEFKITYDPDLQFVASEGADCWVAILGRIVTLDLASTIPGDVAAFLARELARSEEAFHSATDGCCGRFVCFYATAEGVRVVGDATGMKMLFYTREPYVAVASHAALLADAFAKPASAEVAEFCATSGIRQYNMAFLPGHATVYDGVRVLVPNTCLTLDRGTIRRVFPRERLQALPYERALEQACGYLRDLAQKVTSIAPLTLSLTAGLDSRLTASAFAESFGRISFFTYIRRGERINAVDAIIADRLAKENNLSHREVFFDHEIDAQSPQWVDYQKFVEVARCNTTFEHFYSLAYAYLATAPRGVVHVRSNIGEICRARYHISPFGEFVDADLPEPEKLVRIYNQWTKCKPHDYTREQFVQYLHETELLTNAYDFDLPALYYWEHLMPMWHASLLLEADMSHDTIGLFNCRRVLMTYLAMPFENQVSKASMIDSIRRLCPTLLAEPFNPPAADVPPHLYEYYFSGGKRPPITVIAHRTADTTVSATIQCGDGQFTGAVQYAFYLLKNSQRIDTRWYSSAAEVVFQVSGVTEADKLEVTGFARELANPEKKLFKQVNVSRPT